MCSAPWYAARSWLRTASAAGASESTPPRSSRASGVRRGDSLTAFTATAVPAIAASTCGRWNGSLASGSRRRTCGKSEKTSAMRAGPRSSGLVTSAARKRLYSASTFNSPSAVRTAQAHECGPCTSTPLTSAIPPRRILSSIAESLASARHLDGGVTEAVDPELEVVDRDALVGGVDQPRGQLRVHRLHREEAVRDGAERVAYPVAVREPGHADRQNRRLGLDLRDEALDRVPKRGSELAARSAAALDPIEVVVALAQHLAEDGLDVRLGLAGKQAAVDIDLAAVRDHVPPLGGADDRRRQRERKQRLQELRGGRVGPAGELQRLVRREWLPGDGLDHRRGLGPELELRLVRGEPLDQPCRFDERVVSDPRHRRVARAPVHDEAK